MRHRHGTAYVMVVAIAGLAGVSALSAMFVLGAQRRIIELQADAGAARTIAMSGLERAVAIMQTEDDWRINRGGVWVTADGLGEGTYRIEVSDPSDDNIADSEADPVTVNVRAVAGGSTQIVTATLRPERDPVESLAYGIFVNSDVSVGLVESVDADTSLRSNGNVFADFATVWPQVIAAGSISGSTYYGGTTPGAPAVGGPDPALIEEYVARGTPIDYNAIPSGTLERLVLSPSINPFGAPAGGAGIYYIDCQSRSITIRRLRVLGTLVLLNPGAGSRIRDEVRFDPAAEDYPSLLVRGSIEIQTSPFSLSESMEGVNFNPPGAPFGGATDSDQWDSYACRFTGIVYTTGDTIISDTTELTAPLQVGGRLTVNGTLNSSYTAGAIGLAPPGFGGELRMVAEAEGVWPGVQ